MRLCEIEGCERVYVARGLCGMHYQRWKKHGDATYTPRLHRDALCDAEGCDRNAWYSTGYCTMHHKRFLRNGHPGLQVKVKLSDEERAERQRGYSRKYREKNPEKAREATRRWGEKNPDYYRQWAVENAEKRRRQNAEWHVANRDRRREQTKQRYAANPEPFRARAMRHWARKRNATIGKIDHERIIRRDAGRCGICGEQVVESDRSFDHIVPLSRGGSHTEDNLQLAHFLCNCRKSARPQTRDHQMALL